MASESSIRLSSRIRRHWGWVVDCNTPRKLVWRARIVLMWAQGDGIASVLRATGETKRTAYRGRDHHVRRGMELKRHAKRPRPLTGRPVLLARLELRPPLLPVAHSLKRSLKPSSGRLSIQSH